MAKSLLLSVVTSDGTVYLLLKAQTPFTLTMLIIGNRNLSVRFRFNHSLLKFIYSLFDNILE